MRFAKLLLAAVCLMPFFFFAASAGAFAQTSASGRDTLERAAFCVGVLKQSRAINNRPGGALRSCDGWQSHGYQSIEDCRARVNDALRQLQDDYDGKRKRYANYVALHLISLEPGIVTLIAAIEARGENVGRTWQKQDHSLAQQCMTKCKGAQLALGQDEFEDCALPCIEQTSQENANVLRCLIAPDKLPF